MGGEKLKTQFFALLLLGVSLFIFIPHISSQQVPEEELTLQEPELGTLDSIRITEQSIILDEVAATSMAGTGPTIWTVIRMLLVLALAAAAIYGVVFFLKKAIKPASVTDPFLKLLSSTHLGANRYAHIISAGSRAWLVGASEGAVNLISEIEDKELIDSMLLEASRKGALSPGRLPDFLSMLRSIGTKTEASSPGTDEIRRRRERLKGM